MVATTPSAERPRKLAVADTAGLTAGKTHLAKSNQTPSQTPGSTTDKSPYKSPGKKPNNTLQARTQPKTDSVEKAVAVASDKLDWSHLAHQLKLDPVVRQVVLNTVVADYNEQQLVLHYRPALQLLVKADSDKKIARAIESAVGLSLTVKLSCKEQLEVETPEEAKLRELEEQRQQAIASIRQDPMTQTLERLFSVKLDESSVKKINPNKTEVNE